ncbi:MAG: BamA/TamA family outer membrane protein, partial [Myxococcales bacterium]|nr:BamA/TamA family outer membrane protein [Myxococcales bacterium]
MIALILGLGLAQAGDGPAWQRTGWGFGGLPAINYNSDEGLGLGAIASIYRYDGETSPYKFSTTLLIFATTFGVHAHKIDFDVLRLAKGRLRITGRINAEITRTNPFCGVGRDVTCDPSEAESQADTLGLEGDDRTRFLRRYYLYSYIRPNIFLGGRYRLGDLETAQKKEVFGTLRAMYYQPGIFGEVTPDDGSKYDQYVDGGNELRKEQGFLNVLQVGLMADTRDFESSPSSGYWVEGSVRGATKIIGSQFDYFGFNTTLRTYRSLIGEKRLVTATRLALDGIVGDVPVREMAEMGGTQIYNFGGGLNAGRGIRQRRFVGRAKGLLQNELRWKFWHVEPAGVGVDFTVLGFSDLLFVAREWSDLGDFARPVAGEGLGLRLAFDDNFIIRTDVGFSAAEDYAPSVYIDI